MAILRLQMVKQGEWRVESGAWSAENKAQTVRRREYLI
jgi:hypothetical protein